MTLMLCIKCAHRWEGDDRSERPAPVTDHSIEVDQVLALIERCLSTTPEFGLDDALWCYAYEPNCVRARHLVYRECGVNTKEGLIAWDEGKSLNEKLAVIARARS